LLTAGGQVVAISDTVDDHLRAVLGTVDVESIRRRRFKVVLDSNHGAGAVLGKPLLEALGCELTVYGAEPTGQFIHRPEPTAENLREVARQSVETGADVVFCQDPDADRLAIIDAGGHYIGEEYTVALVLDHVLPQRRGHVVTNCSTSRMAADLAAKHGCTFSLSAVGEANVTDEMIRRSAVYGGEGNGGPIDPRVGYVRDSFVGMAQVLDSMAARNQTIDQLVAGLPRYEICKTTIPIARTLVPALLDRLEETFPEATASRIDGLRLDWPDSKWLLIRPSNTEPIVRAVAEATSMAAAQHLCDKSANLSGQL
jgi:phosphomannomutase